MEKPKQIWLVVEHVQVGDEVIQCAFYDEKKAKDFAALKCKDTGTRNFEAQPLVMEDA